jgi:ribose transport system substrate-binding protein
MRIGVLYWSMGIPGQVAMRQGVEAEVERINRKVAGGAGSRVALIPFVAGDGQAGIERQIEQFFQLIEQGPDVILVQPTDNAALAGPLRETP